MIPAFLPLPLCVIKLPSVPTVPLHPLSAIPQGVAILTEVSPTDKKSATFFAVSFFLVTFAQN